MVNTVYSFMERLKRNELRLNDNEKNFILYSLTKAIDFGDKISCPLSAKDAFYFFDIRDGDNESLKIVVCELYKKLSVKLRGDTSTLYLQLLDEFLYDGNGVVVKFNLNNIEKWLKSVEG